MSAAVLTTDADGAIRCPYCDSDDLNPKAGLGGDVWVTACGACGVREPMIWPHEEEDR